MLHDNEVQNNIIFEEERKAKGGIPKKSLKEVEMKEKFICGKCKNIIWDILICQECDEYSCGVCVEENKTKKFCPICQEEGRYMNEKKKATIIKKNFEDLKFTCWNSPRCEETLKYITMSKHFCPYDKISCPNEAKGCPKVERGKLAIHKNECLYETIKCECGQEYMRKEEEEHKTICIIEKCQCEFCQKVGIPRQEMRKHHDQCPKYPSECEYCHKNIPRDEQVQGKHKEECPEIIVEVKCKCENIQRKNMKEHEEKCKNFPIQCTNECKLIFPRRELSKGSEHDCANYLIADFKSLKDNLNDLQVDNSSLEEEIAKLEELDKNQQIKITENKRILEDLVFICSSEDCPTKLGFNEVYGQSHQVFQCLQCQKSFCKSKCLSPCEKCDKSKNMICKQCCYITCAFCLQNKKYCTNFHKLSQCTYDRCSKFLCSEHLFTSRRDPKYIICQEHKIECKVCNYTISREEAAHCSTKTDELICSNKLYKDCSKICEVCEQISCNICLNYQCKKCKKYTCTNNCTRKCGICMQPICDSCKLYCQCTTCTLIDEKIICDDCLFLECSICGKLCKKCQTVEPINILDNPPLVIDAQQITLNRTHKLYLTFIFKALWHNPKLETFVFGILIYIYIF